VFARLVMDIGNPRVGLLSNGEEQHKGNELTRESHALLQTSSFNYTGYVEGRDIFNSSADVIVCDGFVGNVVLKTTEGLAEAVAEMLRREITSRFWAKIGFLLAKPAFMSLKKRIDYAEVGGAPLLGIQGTAMICHGGSSSVAIMNAIRQARDSISKDVNRQLIAALQK